VKIGRSYINPEFPPNFLRIFKNVLFRIISTFELMEDFEFPANFLRIFKNVLFRRISTFELMEVFEFPAY
jgi:hypothetical protein